MPSAIAFIRWDNYTYGEDGQGFFEANPLTFNSRQERLHALKPDDKLWLVSRCPDDQQYYFVSVLWVASIHHNSPSSNLAQQFGRYAIVVDRTRSLDLGKKFPAEGLLRALEFESSKPIKYGSSIGQSLQTIRILTPSDELVLETALSRIMGKKGALEDPVSLWTKCDSEFAGYFLKNWQATRKPLAFLLYDSPPVVPAGAPVFIHSNKKIRLIASFRTSQFVSGHKQTVEPSERIAERERIWVTYRINTIEAPDKEDFNYFWDAQNGVRALVIIENVIEVPKPSPFKEYGKALEWGYPIGVGYRYLTFSQTILILRAVGLFETGMVTHFLRLVGNI